MAKHTFGNRELAHAYFHQQEFGIDYGNGSSFSFRGNKIYSYSSCIGVADFEKKIFKFRSASYSNSTSKHQRYVGGAIPHDWKVFRWKSWNRFDDNRSWFEDLIIEVRNDKYYLTKGTRFFGNPDLIDNIRNRFKEFSDAFDLPKLYDEYVEELNKLIWTDKELEMHKIKAWCANTGITGSYENKVKVFNNPELAAENIAKNKEKKAKLEATKEERKQKAIQKSIDKWYSGESISINFGSSSRRSRYIFYKEYPVYLRINPNDPKEVETSKGVKIPLVECALLYRKFKQCVETNTEWHQNGEKFRIGMYHVEKIHSVNGEYQLVAGCHVIKATQIEEFVNKFTDWNK